MNKFNLKVEVQGDFILNRNKYNVLPENNPIESFINRCLNSTIEGSTITSVINGELYQAIINKTLNSNTLYNLFDNTTVLKETFETYKTSNDFIYKKQLRKEIVEFIIKYSDIEKFNGFYQVMNNPDNKVSEKDKFYLYILIAKEANTENCMFIDASICYETEYRKDHDYLFKSMYEDKQSLLAESIGDLKMFFNNINVESNLISSELIDFHQSTRFKRQKCVHYDS